MFSSSIENIGKHMEHISSPMENILFSMENILFFYGKHLCFPDELQDIVLGT